MKKYILNLIFLSLLSIPLRADEASSSEIGKFHQLMMGERQSMMLECRADYIEKEIIISQKMRELHNDMNDCMKQNKADHSNYLKDRETLEELKVLRKKVRAEYMKNMKYLHNL